MKLADRPLIIVYLYPDDMNFYGDSGNVRALKQRLLWREIACDVVSVHIGDPLPENADIVVGGGGQDNSQISIAIDLQRHRDQLHSWAAAGVPMLMICGMYQLFGKRFVTDNNTVINGISIFDLETIAGQQRLIGNICIETDFGKLVGYENHSGQTHLGPEQAAFGSVIHGHGNSERSAHEGARTHNVYGTYLHGAVLPRNPLFADTLISQALSRRDVDFTLQDLPALDDKLATEAQAVAFTRPL